MCRRYLYLNVLFTVSNFRPKPLCQFILPTSSCEPFLRTFSNIAYYPTLFFVRTIGFLFCALNFVTVLEFLFMFFFPLEMHISLQLALAVDSTAKTSSHSAFLPWDLPNLEGTCLPTFHESLCILSVMGCYFSLQCRAEIVTGSNINYSQCAQFRCYSNQQETYYTTIGWISRACVGL